MKRRDWFFSMTIGLLISTSLAMAADPPVAKKEEPKQPPEIDQQEMMKLWMKVATPGKPHKLLQSAVGKWTTTSKMWMAGPDGPVTDSKGTAEFTSILGGRFIMHQTKGELFGMPYEGLGLMGYDNYKKKYIMSWIDSSGTAMHTAQGTLDRTGKVITFYGTMDEFLTGEHDKAVKYVLRLVDDDKHIFEIHDLGIVDGKKENTMVVQITYDRKK